MDRVQALEERISHLIRTHEELSDVVARQDRELIALNKRVRLLMEREAERELTLGQAPEANVRPPHW